MKRIACAAAAALVLTACSSPPEVGTVRDKRYSPESTVVVSSCSGKPLACVPIPITNDATWDLRLVDGGRDGWRSVDPEDYMVCQVGERYPNCGDRETE